MSLISYHGGTRYWERNLTCPCLEFGVWMDADRVRFYLDFCTMVLE